MKKKKIVNSIITIALLNASLLSLSSVKAGTSATATQATATLSSSCTIVAQNLNFGALVLPLSAQSASTSMNVLCSKNHAYTVGLAYGGVYGQGASINLPLTVNSGRNGYAYCVYSETINGQLYQTSTNYGQTCASSIAYNIPSYAYGKMIGSAKGDNVAYSIQVPGQPGQIWNAGNYTYSSTGTGASQTIPVVGTLVPGQSGSSYPTPDTYMDTVTATVNF
jgi:spore coat protein U-like protein